VYNPATTPSPIVSARHHAAPHTTAPLTLALTPPPPHVMQRVQAVLEFVETVPGSGQVLAGLYTALCTAGEPLAAADGGGFSEFASAVVRPLVDRVEAQVAPLALHVAASTLATGGEIKGARIALRPLIGVWQDTHRPWAAAGPTAGSGDGGASAARPVDRPFGAAWPAVLAACRTVVAACIGPWLTGWRDGSAPLAPAAAVAWRALPENTYTSACAAVGARGEDELVDLSVTPPAWTVGEDGTVCPASAGVPAAAEARAVAACTGDIAGLCENALQLWGGGLVACQRLLPPPVDEIAGLIGAAPVRLLPSVLRHVVHPVAVATAVHVGGGGDGEGAVAVAHLARWREAVMAWLSAAARRWGLAWQAACGAAASPPWSEVAVQLQWLEAPPVAWSGAPKALEDAACGCAAVVLRNMAKCWTRALTSAAHGPGGGSAADPGASDAAATRPPRRGSGTAGEVAHAEAVSWRAAWSSCLATASGQDAVAAMCGAATAAAGASGSDVPLWTAVQSDTVAAVTSLLSVLTHPAPAVGGRTGEVPTAAARRAAPADVLTNVIAAACALAAGCVRGAAVLASGSTSRSDSATTARRQRSAVLDARALLVGAIAAAGGPEHAGPAIAAALPLPLPDDVAVAWQSGSDKQRATTLEKALEGERTRRPGGGGVYHRGGGGGGGGGGQELRHHCAPPGGVRVCAGMVDALAQTLRPAGGGEGGGGGAPPGAGRGRWGLVDQRDQAGGGEGDHGYDSDL
jgi:hypothetical protein